MQDQGDALVVEGPLFIVSLIVNASFFPQAAKVLSETNGLRSLQHGTNTYSRFSTEGGWVIVGPSKEIVLQVMRPALASASVLASANVESQWSFATASLPEAAQQMGRIICRQIPAFDVMSPVRKTEVTREMGDLCLSFAKDAGGKLDRFVAGNLLWDTTPGRLLIPRPVAGESTSDLTLDAVEALNRYHGMTSESLVYWWESVFTAWWKGFW